MIRSIISFIVAFGLSALIGRFLIPWLRALKAGQTIKEIGPTEFALLRILLERQGKVVSAEELFHAIWADEYYCKSSNTISVHIRHLREKMQDTAEGPKYIKTVWGVGYQIER